MRLISCQGAYYSVWHCSFPAISSYSCVDRAQHKNAEHKSALEVPDYHYHSPKPKLACPIDSRGRVSEWPQTANHGSNGANFTSGATVYAYLMFAPGWIGVALDSDGSKYCSSPPGSSNSIHSYHLYFVQKTGYQIGCPEKHRVADCPVQYVRSACCLLFHCLVTESVQRSLALTIPHPHLCILPEHTW